MHYDKKALTLLSAALAFVGLALNGCSGTGAATGATINPNTPTTVTQTLITDAPADQVLSLSLIVNSITLTDASGASASVLSSSVPVEASHLDAVQEPLLPPLNIPQDTYTSATITVSSPVVVYVDPTTGKPVKTAATLAAASTTVTFTTPITISSTSTPICFDLLVGQSVAFSGTGTSTVVTVTPTFNVFQIPLASAPTNGSNGKVSGIVGQVVSVSGTTLVIQGPSGKQFTLATNTNTILQGFTSLSTLTAGEPVDADVALQKDGTLLALRIHLHPAAAANMLVGPVTAVTGSPATSFTQLVRQPAGPGVSSTATATTYTITVNGSTTFALAPQAGTLPTLPFTPVFTAATLIAGQNVAVDTSSISGTTATAASVILAPQTVGGTVASVGVAPGGMQIVTVTLPAQSALATLTGSTSVVVYVTINTQMMNATAALPIVGSQIRFNGLLFNDSGTLRMLAGGCNDFPPAAPPQKH
jgi:hypothetical protein